MKGIFKKLIRPVSASIAVIIVTIIFIVFTSWILYGKTSRILDANLRERLLSIVTTAATEFDPHDLEQLRVEPDWLKPEWAKVVHQMERIRKNNDKILFVYMFRKSDVDPKSMVFVADSHSIDPFAKIDLNGDGVIDDSDQLQWPGQPYDVSEIPETFDAYNGPTTNKNIYSDQWGPVLTGYAPIKDENGNVVAILAVDIKAGDFALITQQTLEPFLIFIVTLSIIVSTLILIMIYSWARYNERLRVVNEKLKELDKQKTEFVSFASHQLRSPLTAIKGYASLILEGDYGAITDDLKKAIQIVFESTKTLSGVIDDYLNVTRIELGEMKYSPAVFDLKDLVQTVIDELKPNVEKAGLELDFDFKKEETYSVSADREKLKQVITNLIDNSVKYTPTGKIDVILENMNGKIKLTVKDTGIGISKEAVVKLFAKFSRAANANKTNMKGTGLGLFIAKEIVEYHKGRIWVESQGEGKGSEFIVELPAA